MINNNEIQKKISQYIGLSFLNPDLLLLLKTNKEFQKIINLLINILINIEASHNDDSSEPLAESFKNTFIQLVGNFNVNLEINVNDEDELVDNVRYFEIFVQNSLNKSINDIANQTSKVDEKIVPDSVIESNKNNDTNYNNQNNHFNAEEFNAEEYIHNSGTNVNEIAEMMVRQQAAMIVNKKITTGQVFIYNSKPKIIPILKIITASLFGILLILTIASSSILLYLNNKIEINLPNNKTGTYLFLPFPAMMIFTFLINGLLIYSLIKNFKNDNVKYRINWLWPLTYTTILLITLLMESGTDKSVIFNPGALKAFFMGNAAKGWETYWPLIEDYRYIQFTCLAIIIAIIVTLIIAIAYNPKRDFERIERLIVEYMNKIKKGEISNDDAFTSFGNRFSSGIF